MRWEEKGGEDKKGENRRKEKEEAGKRGEEGAENGRRREGGRWEKRGVEKMVPTGGDGDWQKQQRSARPTVSAATATRAPVII